MADIYLRIFVSPDADISNERIIWDIYLARRILAPLRIFRIPSLANGGFYSLPQNYDYSTITCSLDGATETELANIDPDNLSNDGRVINVYYLGGPDDGACASVGFSTNENRGSFPILGSIYMSNFNDDFGKYLFAHELVHLLYARLVNLDDGNLEITMDDPTAPADSNDPGHSQLNENLMNPIVPDSSPFVEAYRQALRQGDPEPPIPQALLTASQRQKALDSQFIFN